MKTLKHWASIALVAVIGFSFAACSDDPGNGPVGGGTAPTITTTALPGGTVDALYTETTLAATGTAPITWSLESDSALPAGLSLNEDTGVISGMPTADGTFTFTVIATNSVGSDDQELTIIISPADGGEPEPIPGMVWIPAGSFTMGSPANEAGRDSDETPHQVTLTGFYMGEYPVTQAKYEEIIGTNPSYFTTPVSPEQSTENRPVETVNWYDAIVFCNRLSMDEGLTPAYKISGSTDPDDWGAVPEDWGGDPIWDAVVIVEGSTGYRLPTEAQWEYACRAGTVTPFYTGNNIATDQANYDGNYPYNSNPRGTYRNRTTTVGDFAPNDYGLFDMHGNVYEWCWDWYSSYGSGAQNNPKGPVSGEFRTMRGGSWYSGAGDLRSACRSNYWHYWGAEFIGLRLVRP
jgi:formylglycine-generating enzyme required for sulfatase activity